MTEEMKLKKSIDRINAMDISDEAKLKRLDNLYWRQVGEQASNTVKAALMAFPSYARKEECRKTFITAVVRAYTA